MLMFIISYSDDGLLSCSKIYLLKILHLELPSFKETLMPFFLGTFKPELEDSHCNSTDQRRGGPLQPNTCKDSFQANIHDRDLEVGSHSKFELLIERLKSGKSALQEMCIASTRCEMRFGHDISDLELTVLYRAPRNGALGIILDQSLGLPGDRFQVTAVRYFHTGIGNVETGIPMQCTGPVVMHDQNDEAQTKIFSQ